ncbi:hypothetical protein AB1M95_03975 [Sulfitobacter sp. LCG007]
MSALPIAALSPSAGAGVQPFQAPTAELAEQRSDLRVRLDRAAGALPGAESGTLSQWNNWGNGFSNWPNFSNW